MLRLPEHRSVATHPYIPPGTLRSADICQYKSSRSKRDVDAHAITAPDRPSHRCPRYSLGKGVQSREEKTR